MASIKDIAQQAGVSIATVSRYFNNRNLIKEETCRKIAAVVQKNNYVPSSQGRSLRLLRSGKILVLMPTMENPTYLRVLSAIESECYRFGYTVLACNTHTDVYKEKYLLQMLESHYADGAVFFSTTLNADELEGIYKRFPIVQCCEYIKGARVPRISVDNHAVAYDAVKCLAVRGHTRIAMLSGTEAYGSTLDRESGYRAALEECGLQFRPEYLIRGRYGFGSGMRETEGLLALPEPPTALYCISDAVAIGALKAARLAGLRLAVIGTDNITAAEYASPALSSVKQPRTLLGETAVKMLLQRIENSKAPCEEVILPHELILRDT